MEQHVDYYKRQKAIEDIAAGIRNVRSVLDDLDENFGAILNIRDLYVPKAVVCYATHHHLCLAYSRLMDIEYKILTYMAAYVASMSAGNQENAGCEDEREKRRARRRTRDRIKRIKSDVQSLNKRLSENHGAIFDSSLTPEGVLGEIKKVLLDIEATHHKAVKSIIECTVEDKSRCPAAQADNEGGT